MAAALTTTRPVLAALGRNLVALTVFWLMAFALVKIAENQFTGWAAPWAALVTGSMFGAFVAHLLRARVAVWMLGALSLYTASRFVIEPMFGSGAVQGFGAHLAGMAVAALLVGLGFVLCWRTTSSRS